jgi:hypothetical protein
MEKTTNTQPAKRFKLKDQQINILILIYKFRFLNRSHIQTLLNHKQRNKIIIWLNELTEHKYLRRYYYPKFAGEPAAYSLGYMARRYFKEQKIKDINLSLLDRVWRESTCTQKFKNHCMLVADIYISLLNLIKQTDGGKGKLSFYTKTDLKGVQYLILPEPDAYFSMEDAKGQIKRYFLDIFDDLPPRMVLRKRIKQYFSYFDKKYWQDNMKHDFPEIILVCPDTTSQNYLNNFIRRTLMEKMDNLGFYLALREEIQQRGISRGILHKVELAD